MDKTTTDQTSLLQNAVALHQRGQLVNALELYQVLLQSNPDHFEALHFSGVIARQQGDPRAGIALIDKAIAVLHSGGIKPNAAHASAWCNLAGCWLDCGEVPQAVDYLRQALYLNPDYAIAHNNLGNALKSQGHYDAAILSYAEALRCLPRYPEAQHNMGLVLYLTDQFEAALERFDLALELRPNYVSAYCSRAIVWLALSQSAHAIEDCDSAIALQPDYAEAYFNRGIAYRRLQQFQLAATSHEMAIHCRADYGKAWFQLGHALQSLNRTTEAIEAYRRAGACGVDPGQINFSLAALGAAAPPDSAPHDYIRELFDQYADHFDAHLLGALHYDVPRLIAATVAPYRPNRLLDTLDLGCGTGLCAPLLRPYALSLTGVDLSQKMIDQANRTEIYDHLLCAELTDFLTTTKSQFDLIVAGDVLVYIGALAPVLQGVGAALLDEGLFCFSVEHAGEVSEPTDYVLQSSQRYKHTESYLRRVIAQCGLELLVLERHIGRTEHQKNADTLIVLTRKVTRRAPNQS